MLIREVLDAQEHPATTRTLRIEEVSRLTTLGKTAIYALIREGDFPQAPATGEAAGGVDGQPGSGQPGTPTEVKAKVTIPEFPLNVVRRQPRRRRPRTASPSQSGGQDQP